MGASPPTSYFISRRFAHVTLYLKDMLDSEGAKQRLG